MSQSLSGESEPLHGEDEAPIIPGTEPASLDGDSSGEDEVDDLADALGCFTLGDYGELRFFGASSNFSIIQNHSLQVTSSMDARKRGLDAACQIPTYFEPSAELRDHLLSIFWWWQNSWQYIVPRDSFV